MSLLASIVDWHDMLQVVWVSIAAGLGVTLVFSIALVGATRAVDYRRGGHGPGAWAYGAVALIASAGVIGCVVLAIVVMVNK
jgi:hypothetical protein